MIPHGPGEDFNSYAHEQDSSRSVEHAAYDYTRNHGPVRLATSIQCEVCGSIERVFGNHVDANWHTRWLCEGCEP